MFLQPHLTNKDSFISDIVKSDHRTAAVFRKYDIDFCCGGKWPLEQVCMNKGLESDRLLEELRVVSRSVQVPTSLNYGNWSVDFLIEYIVNIHHEYLRHALKDIKVQLEQFVVKHIAKYPHLSDLEKVYDQLVQDTLPHLQEEEEVIFPYIRQLSAASKEKAPYGKLFVRTLRKPLESFFQNEHESTGKLIRKMRTLTENYTTPANACIKHQVTYALLRDLDDNLAQHLYLENEVLFPRASGLEKELLHIA